jgi:hypothetical protein
MSYPWPDKTVSEFTDVELAAAIEAHHDAVNDDLVQSCIREWERRRDLPQT